MNVNFKISEGKFGIRLETDIEVVKAADYVALFRPPVVCLFHIQKTKSNLFLYF